MAHVIKSRKPAPTFIPARANRAERQMRRMAAIIKTEAQFQAVAAQFKPELRDKCVARLLPYLSFKPSALKVESA